jgi:hypothetical protein
MRPLSIDQRLADWRKSSHSQGTSGNCVEVCVADTGSERSGRTGHC